MRSRFDLTRQGASQNEDELGLTRVDCITLREERRIEEAPAAYKPIQLVIDVQVAAEKQMKFIIKRRFLMTSENPSPKTLFNTPLGKIFRI
jgi:RNA-splicing ligase RtcB